MTNSNEKMITISAAEYEKLQEKIKVLSENNNNLIEDINWLKEKIAILEARRFKAATEELPPEAYGQLSLLANEAEWYLDYKPDKEDIEVAKHTRKKTTGSVREKLPDNIPVEIREHRPENIECPQCGETMTEIGKEERCTLKIIPAQVIVLKDIYYTYACKNCEKNDITTPVVKAPRDNNVIPGSISSPEAIAHIMTQKYCMGSPLYRQECELRRQGIELSRQTMSNWIITATQKWLSPLYDVLKEELCKREVLHADETTLRVLKEEKKGSGSKCYMWLYRTSGDTDKHIILYDYQKSRSGNNPKEFLKGFKGYLHTDGYQVYHNLNENITVVGCLSHLRRKLHEAVEAGVHDEKYTTAAAKGEAYCTQIANLEKKLKDLSPAERYTERLKTVKPVFEALLSWAETINAAPKSKLGKALYYLKEQRKYLANFYLDGRLELTNNRAERSIKVFVIDRKNFLFANTPSGARATATMLSMIEMAKENSLDPYKYLTYIFKVMPNTDISAKDALQQFLPWNAPDDCRA